MGHARIAAVSDVGCVREANQDEFLLGRLGQGLISARSTSDPLDTEGLVLAVADGMGGMPDGDLASRLAVDAIGDRLASETLVCAQQGSLRDRLAPLVRNLFTEAHSRIVEANHGREPHLMMGTTLTLAVVWRNQAMIGNVGDSRMYLLRAGKARALTTDQTVANFLVRFGHISEREALQHPERKVLAQALGHGNEIEVDIEYLELEKGDVLLACSDGLSDLLEAHEVHAHAWDTMIDPDQRLQNLVELAKGRGGHDNITIVSLDYLG